MKIVLGTQLGFCYGVKKAVEIAERTATESSTKIYTYGPLIHNNYEINRLKKLGVIPLNISSDRNFNNKTILVRTHGLPKNIISELKEKKNKIIDTTCPLVKKVQKLVEELSKKGFNIIIYGDKSHPEVVALVSYSLKPAQVIQSIDDLNIFTPLKEPVAVVSQTTQSKDEFKELSLELKKKYKNIKILNTICTVASERQEEAEKIAKQVEVMLVVGGKNSGNTIRLRDISAKYTKTYHIESFKDIKNHWFKRSCTTVGHKVQPHFVNSVGIITGTSTPQWLIDDVIEYVGSLGNV